MTWEDRDGPRRARALAVPLTLTALAGCGGAQDGVETDPELASVVREVSVLAGVEAVGAGRDGDAANITITVTPDSSPERGAELLDEGVRQLWQSELEPWNGIRVAVTPVSPGRGSGLRRARPGAGREELVAEYGDR